MNTQDLSDQEIIRTLTQLMAEALRRGIDVPSITEDATTASALRLKAYEAKKAKEAKNWSIKSAAVKALQAIGYGYFELNRWSPLGSDEVRYYFSVEKKSKGNKSNYVVYMIVGGNPKYPDNYVIATEHMKKNHPNEVARLSKLLPVVYHDLMNPSFNTELVADIEPSQEHLEKYLEILGVKSSATPEPVSTNA